MARLPIPGSDRGTWGNILNEFLSVSLDTDGTIKAAAISSKADAADLTNVDNTSDANKPISTATQTALDLKANDSAVVHDTGDETIAGIKTFSSSPIVPEAPTTNAQAAPKSYVDTSIADLPAFEAGNLIDAPLVAGVRTVGVEYGVPQVIHTEAGSERVGLIENTTTETTIFEFIAPALNDRDQIDLDVGFGWLNNSAGSTSLTVRLKISGTTILTFVPTGIAANAAIHGCSLRANMMVDTASFGTYFQADFGMQGTSNALTNERQYSRSIGGLIAISGATISVTIQHGAADLAIEASFHQGRATLTRMS